MSKKITLEKVPFEKRWRYEGDTRIDDDWHMASYPSWDPERNEWRPNEPFEAVLEIIGKSRGRSSAVFHWRDVDTGTEYPMFMSSLLELIQDSEKITYGHVRETWIGVKRGANYGIARYGV